MFAFILSFYHIKILKTKGQEQAQKMFKWLQVVTGLGVVQVNSDEQIKKLNAENEVVILGFYNNLDSEQAKLFIEISKRYYDLKFGITSNQDLFTQYKIGSNGNLIAFKHVRF
jgi:protein disulfide-isomerase A1